ncbi:hypothetical protein VTK26DRAFT_5366 [Humicola hyalothermophila]
MADRPHSISPQGPSGDGRNWYRERQGALKLPRARGKKGPRSLLAMALRALADNIGAADKDMIRCLPERLQMRLWKELVPRTISLHAWTLLSSELHASAFRNAASLVSAENREQTQITLPMGLCRYHEEIDRPTCRLDVYTAPLMATQALVFLCIDSVGNFGPEELLHLAQLPSLAVLELTDRDPFAQGISDRVIRGWAETGPVVFPALRVLRISSRAGGVSEASLRYVLRFPKLEIFDVMAAPAAQWQNAEAIATEQHWRVTSPMHSCFASYARAYLNGEVPVTIEHVDALSELYDDDQLKVSLGCDPRLPATSTRAIGKKSNLSYPSLDEDWQALLKDEHPLGAGCRLRGSRMSSFFLGPEMPLMPNEVFWFLALLAQWEHNPARGSIRAQAQDITLPPERVVTLRLSNHPLSAQPLHDGRLIFSCALRCKSKPQTQDAQPSGGARERSVTDLRPRKRQNVGDMLSSFGNSS